ncbi:MAG: OsmC family protein [Chloroflexi bacterium]|nr:OsmC family protein [Chloroflexota bacterium]
MADAEVTWVGGMAFEGTTPTGHTVVLDAGEAVGGENKGFRPLSLLLVGLAGCTAMDVISILRKKRQDVTGLQVRVEAERAPDHPKVYTDIVLEFIVQGHDVDERAVARAIELSQTKYCSASGMLGKVAQISAQYRIEEVAP